MASAEMKAKQLAMEEQRRKQEFEKQLELKQTIEQAQIEAERVQFEAQERRKTQEAKDEAARLAAEVEGLEKVKTMYTLTTLSLYLIGYVILKMIHWKKSHLLLLINL